MVGMCDAFKIFSPLGRYAVVRVARRRRCVGDSRFVPYAVCVENAVWNSMPRLRDGARVSVADAAGLCRRVFLSSDGVCHAAFGVIFPFGRAAVFQKSRSRDVVADIGGIFDQLGLSDRTVHKVKILVFGKYYFLLQGAISCFVKIAVNL